MKMKLRAYTIPAFLAVLVLLLAACGPQDAAETPPDPVYEADYQALLVGLEANGAQVEEAGIIQEPIIGTDARQVNVNGFPVQVIVFADEQARLGAQEQLTQQPNMIPETGLAEAGQVLIWGQGNLMAIYTGTDLGVVEPMNDVLGAPLLILESGTNE
jgi:hypothetical protein